MTSRSNIITDPGKFEGEPAFVPDYWESALAGQYDADDGEAYVFYINEDDIRAYPELKGVSEMLLTEDEQGFVRARLIRPG